jgi:hypothetical protein
MTARVKVDKAMLIKALQDRLALGEKANAIQEKNNAKYEADKKAWAEKLASLAKSGKLDFDDVSVSTWRNQVEIRYTYKETSALPKEPERADSPEGVLPNHQAEEINNTIKLLNMTTDPFVGASLYKDVVRYI